MSFTYGSGSGLETDVFSLTDIDDLGKLKQFFKYLNLLWSSFFHLPSGFLNL